MCGLHPAREAVQEGPFPEGGPEALIGASVAELSARTAGATETPHRQVGYLVRWLRRGSRQRGQQSRGVGGVHGVGVVKLWKC